MNVLHLQTPLMVNDTPRHELTYDTAEITVSQFCEAESYRFVVTGGKPVMSTHETDHGMHLYLGMMAIIAVNPDIDIRDLERVKGYDLVQIMNVGRNFILRGQGGGTGSSQKQSENSSEPTPDITTQASEKSDDNA